MSPLLALFSSVVVWFASGLPLPAQQPPQPGTTKEDDDVLKAGPKDPYTGQDPAAMAAAGIVRYGPFPWADFKTTTDIDRVLGEGRVLWLETAHFRIGCNLKTLPMPQEQEPRKVLLDQIRTLRKKLPKVPEKPKKLDPWLWLHLNAQRAEALYAEIATLLGVTDQTFTGKEIPTGPFLGLPDKYLILLFQKKSDMARYMERFCSVQADKSYRHYHVQTFQLLTCMAVEGFETFDDDAQHTHLIYTLVHNLLNGYRGFYYDLPYWLDEGLAHWYSRRVKSTFINAMARADEAVDEENQHEWPRKVRARAQHERGFIPFATMAGWQKRDELGYQGHIQAWSRVDYLMSLGADKFAPLLQQLKSIPLPRDGSTVPRDQVDRVAQKALMEIWSLDAATFDAQWRAFVLATYPKK